MSGRIVFIADSLDNAYKFQRVFTELDVEIAAGSTLQIRRLLQSEEECSLVVFEARGNARTRYDEVESLVTSSKCPLLLIADESDIADLRFPALVPSDFVVHGSTQAECLVRTRRLLGITEPSVRAHVITIGDMLINLDTYQVTIADEPVDFTYLEYALLAFLVQNSNHAFSRDALLQQVWGIDYYGGSRTVDVHVRRIRSKLGPSLAQYLETVRGVGYLWRSA